MRLIDDIQSDDYKNLLYEITTFYDHILDETIQLMNLYSCKTPLEVYCLFNMINDFYIRNDEIFRILHGVKEGISNFEELESSDIKGVQVLLNGGVCRHRSAMLCDIYKRMGFDSAVLVGRTEVLAKISYGNSQNKQISDRMYVDNMLRKISDGASIEEFKSHLKRRKISYHVQDVHDDSAEKYRKKHNHAIVMVGDDKSYYLDPMNNVVYNKDENDVITLRNRSGLYFFSYPKISKFFMRYGSSMGQESIDMYDRLLQLPVANYSETLKNVLEIYSYLRQFKNGIEEFAKSKKESIEDIRGKSLSLSTKQKWTKQ